MQRDIEPSHLGRDHGLPQCIPWTIISEISYRDINETHLHQCLGIIACPLIEALAIWEAAKPWI